MVSGTNVSGTNVVVSGTNVVVVSGTNAFITGVNFIKGTVIINY